MSTMAAPPVIPAQAKTHDSDGATPMGSRPRGDDAKAVARQFEALIVGQMLRSARAASLADDPLRSRGSATYTDMIDAARAQQLAATAPLGVARLLAR